jgi:hypothetical protein
MKKLLTSLSLTAAALALLGLGGVLTKLFFQETKAQAQTAKVKERCVRWRVFADCSPLKDFSEVGWN